MQKIKLTQGKFALVDDEDFEWVSQWKWQLNNKGYVYRQKYSHRKNGKCVYKKIYLHRLINNTPEGFETDHIDRNPFNNQKSNLRTVNKGRNNLNRNIYKNNACGVKGVYWHKKTKQYHVRITVDKKVISLGYYHNIQQANVARQEGERLYAI
jgi:hypothetical protein